MPRGGCGGGGGIAAGVDFGADGDAVEKLGPGSGFATPDGSAATAFAIGDVGSGGAFEVAPAGPPGSAGGTGMGPAAELLVAPAGMPGSGGGPPVSGARNDSGERASPSEARLNGTGPGSAGEAGGGGVGSFDSFGGKESVAGGSLSFVLEVPAAPDALAMPNVSRAPATVVRAPSLRPFFEFVGLVSAAFELADLDCGSLAVERLGASPASCSVLLVFDWSCAI